MNRALAWLRLEDAPGLLSLTGFALHVGVFALIFMGWRGVAVFGIAAALLLARGWFEYRQTMLAMKTAHESAALSATTTGVAQAALDKRLADLEQKLLRFGQEQAEEKLGAAMGGRRR